MNRLKFEPKLHAYTLDDKPITGVTTILKIIAKPALINWAANMAVDYISKYTLENPNALDDRGRICSLPDNLKTILDKARKAHIQKRDKAGDIGKEVHSYIETFIKTKQIPEIKDPKAKKMFDNFYLWQKANKVKFLQSERQVYSEKYWYCGTYDFLCEIEGKTWLGDIKSGKYIYSDVWAQMAGYQICEQEMNPSQKIDGFVVVRLGKDGDFEEKRSISNDDYKDLFLSALKIYRVQEKIKNSIL